MNNGLPGIRDDGLTLVELMIAMALSLLLIGGAIGIFFSSKQAYHAEDALSRNQEAGRFALGVLNRHIRSAGYTGCSNPKDIRLNVIASPAPAEDFTVSTSVLGFEGGSDNAKNFNSTWQKTSSWVPNTDVLIISSGGVCGAGLTTDLGTRDASIHISGDASCGFQAKDALLITDCEAADLFRATSVSVDGTNITIAHADSYNSTESLSRAYKKKATVMRFLQSTYFIGISPNGDPALYRADLDGNTEELVNNVASMQIRYGVDNGEDGMVDEYHTANEISDWSRVLSAQLSLLIRSANDAVTESQTVTFDGVQINNVTESADKRLRSIFNASVGIRNRLP